MQCPICARSFATVSMLLKHIRLTHADRPDFNLQCNLQGCKRTFKRFTTFRNHIYHNHDVEAITDGDCDVDDETGDSDLTSSDTPLFTLDDDDSEAPDGTCKLNNY